MNRIAGPMIRAIGLVAACAAWCMAASAEEPKQADRTARQTVEAYLAAVLAGKGEAATALALPGSVEGSEKRIAEYRELFAGNTIRAASSHVSTGKEQALVITEEVKLAKAARDGRDKGPLIVKLTKLKGGWLVRDVDFKTEERAKEELKEFLAKYPDAKAEPAPPGRK